MTKLEKILQKKNMSYGDLIRKIHENTGFKIGLDRISRICNGILQNYTIVTAKMIADALEVKVDDIIELKTITKTNKRIFSSVKKINHAILFVNKSEEVNPEEIAMLVRKTMKEFRALKMTKEYIRENQAEVVKLLFSFMNKEVPKNIRAALSYFLYFKEAKKNLPKPTSVENYSKEALKYIGKI